jgi:hypothetical protein
VHVQVALGGIAEYCEGAGSYGARIKGWIRKKSMVSIKDAKTGISGQGCRLLMLCEGAETDGSQYG